MLEIEEDQARVDPTTSTLATGTTLRRAQAADVPLILELIRALAEYEREPDAVTATEEGLLRDGFGEKPFYECLIAEHGGRAAGFAFYFFNYSTWKGRPGLYLEDLFVKPEFRGLGIGKALLAQVARIAQENGCPRLQWEVLDWNTPAIEFYRGLGADFLDEWRNARMTEAAIARLASLAGPLSEHAAVGREIASEPASGGYEVGA